MSHSVPTRAGRLDLLTDVALTIRGSESVAVVGRSGSGKTTLLSILGLMQRPTAGTLLVNGQDTGRLSDRRLSRLRNDTLGFVFQGYSLMPHLNALENVMLPLTYGARPSAAARRRAVDLLEGIGLGGAARRMPRQLSGGEQQRVAIARSLVREPAVVLADEPTGALDVSTGDAVMGALLDLVADQGTALVLVTHDAQLAGRMSRQVTIDRGRIVETPVGAR